MRAFTQTKEPGWTQAGTRRTPNGCMSMPNNHVSAKCFYKACSRACCKHSLQGQNAVATGIFQARIRIVTTVTKPRGNNDLTKQQEKLKRKQHITVVIPNCSRMCSGKKTMRQAHVRARKQSNLSSRLTDPGVRTPGSVSRLTDPGGPDPGSVSRLTDPPQRLIWWMPTFFIVFVIVQEKTKLCHTFRQEVSVCL